MTSHALNQRIGCGHRHSFRKPRLQLCSNRSALALTKLGEQTLKSRSSRLATETWAGLCLRGACISSRPHPASTRRRAGLPDTVASSWMLHAVFLCRVNLVRWFTQHCRELTDAPHFVFFCQVKLVRCPVVKFPTARLRTQKLPDCSSQTSGLHGTKVLSPPPPGM